MFDFFTLQGLLVGLLGLAVGLAFTFYGFKLFLILLPIWGFFAGLTMGASAMNAFFGDGFLAGALGIIIGLAIGVLFAVLSYLYYWAAVILLGGFLGYSVGMGLLTWFGFNPEGWIAFLLALIVGVLFALAFLVVGMPAIIAIVATAIGGAAAAIAGVVVAIGTVPLAALDDGIMGVFKGDDLSWFWVLCAVVLAIAGMVYQARQTRDMTDRIKYDQYQNPGLNTPTGAAPA